MWARVCSHYLLIAATESILHVESYATECVAMQRNAAQFQQIADLLPRQRGNVKGSNLQVINAILFVAANGCKWRALPEHYGKWHTV